MRGLVNIVENWIYNLAQTPPKSAGWLKSAKSTKYAVKGEQNKMRRKQFGARV